MVQERVSWHHRYWRWIIKELHWLKPGLGVKRWLVLIVAGTTLLGIGFAVLVLDFYRTAPDTWWLPVLSAASLRFLDRPVRALIFGGIGLAMILYGTWRLNRALIKPFLRPGKHILEAVADYRRKERGPRIVTIGGGTGMSTLLRGLKKHSHNLTAVVTVADDGGSSGELRRTIGILPPGDFRNCLAALSNDEALLAQLFQYRFAAISGLNGHTLGNLLITALIDITGSFEEALAESGKVLAVTGQVLPATLHDVRLVASKRLPSKEREVVVRGQSRIPQSDGQIMQIWLEPSNPLAFPPAIQSILSADLIIVGPGSLYTSIMPNLLVPDIADALRSSRAVKFYIGNIATQPGETENFRCGSHIRVIEKLLGKNIFDILIFNSYYEAELQSNSDWVVPEEGFEGMYETYFTNLVDMDKPWRHDSEKLAQVTMDLFNERTGPLSLKEYD